jgi:hypothetical protein
MEHLIQFLTRPVAGVETVNALFGIDDTIIFLVLFVISTALSFLLAPKAPKPPDAQLEDVKAPQNDPSQYVSVVFGRARIKDPIIAWFGNTHAEPIMSDEGGKK